MKLIIDIPDSDCIAVKCEGLYYIGHDKLAESVTTAFQTAMPYEESPQGEWIDHCHQNFRCSICGYIITDSDVDEYNYCPNCGAQMKKGGAENEDVFTRKEELSKEESEWLIDFITKEKKNE